MRNDIHGRSQPGYAPEDCVSTKPGEFPYCVVVQRKSNLSRHIERYPTRNSRKESEMEKREGSDEEDKERPTRKKQRTR